MILARLGAYTREAAEAIWRNRTRSLLTTLGMVIGTASIIAVLGISRAASGGIAGTLGTLGDQGVVVTVDSNQDDPAQATLQYRDARTVGLALGPRLDHIEPSYQRQITLRANGITYTTFAASGSEIHRDTFNMREGRRLDAADLAGAAPVCLMTAPLADRFFPGGSALGRVIRAGGSRCTLVGVYARIEGGLYNAGGGDFLELPYTFFRKIAPGPIDALLFYPAGGVSATDAGDAVTRELQQIHGARTRYTVQDQTAQFTSFQRVLDVIANALTGIGGVALLVAGIGITNIMLVSVTERTREIGLRKAIGASRRDVAVQFLLEAILLSALGGGIGTVFGFFLTLAAYGVVASFVGPAPIPYLLIVSVAVGFSTLVGTVFGTYPALRAARLDPIAALRS